MAQNRLAPFCDTPNTQKSGLGKRETRTDEVCGEVIVHILLAENDVPLARSLECALSRSGMLVHHEDNGTDAATRALAESFSLLVVDLDLPAMSGFECMRRMRVAGSTTPILVLASQEAGADRVGKLHFGADGYLMKPFGMAAFETEVKTLLDQGRPKPSPVLQCRGLILDTCTGSTSLNREPVTLRRRERALLQALMTRAGSVVKKERLSAEIGLGETASPNVLELHVARLRKKLAGGPEIRTVRGLGYLMMAG